MDLLIGTVLFTIFSFCLCDVPFREITSNLTVINGAPWGDWGEVELCPKGYADAFAVKILEYQDSLPWQEDMESVRLQCSDGTVIESSSAQSSERPPGTQCLIGTKCQGKRHSELSSCARRRCGTWSEFRTCPTGYLIAFSLRVHEYQGAGDDTAANNIQFKCSDGTVLKDSGHRWGKFGDWSPSCVQGYICGLQAKVDHPQGAGHATGLNDVKFFCCT